MSIPKGTTVRQVVPAIEGVVADTRFNSERDELEYLVAYTSDGEDHTRWFAESELQEKSS
jgi:hypothetical protein